MLPSEILASHGTDKVTGHAYGPVYDQLLDPIRHTVRRVLEIGVHRGASLLAWRDLFPNAWVHGLDSDPKCVDRVSADRVVTHLGDQADPRVLDQLGGVYGPFDFVCDDGSHRPADQFTSLLYLWQHVRPGGVYVIEDVQDPEPVKALFGCRVVDLRGSGVYDDCLIVLHKE